MASGLKRIDLLARKAPILCKLFMTKRVVDKSFNREKY